MLGEVKFSKCRLRGCNGVASTKTERMGLCGDHYWVYEATVATQKPRRKIARRAPATYVYAAITLDLDKERVKFGYSIDPTKRIDDLKCGCPVKIGLGAYIAGGEPLEKKIHKYCAEQHVQGEWFDLEGRAEQIFNLMKEKNLQELNDILSPIGDE